MRRSSSWDEVRMINKYISPGCKLGDFFYYFLFNWLPQVGFLTWCTINVLLFTCLINDRCSSMKNTLNYICDWRTAAVCAVWQHRGQHRHINQGKWNSIRQTKSSGPNRTIFHIVVVLPLWQYRRSGFPLDPKIHFESTLLSTMAAAALWLVCSEAAAALSALCDTVFVFAECGTSYSMCCTFHIWWRAGLFCLQTEMYKLTAAYALISAAHVWRGWHPKWFQRVLFWTGNGFGHSVCIQNTFLAAWASVCVYGPKNKSCVRISMGPFVLLDSKALARFLAKLIVGILVKSGLLNILSAYSNVKVRHISSQMQT